MHLFSYHSESRWRSPLPQVRWRFVRDYDKPWEWLAIYFPGGIILLIYWYFFVGWSFFGFFRSERGGKREMNALGIWELEMVFHVASNRCLSPGTSRIVFLAAAMEPMGGGQWFSVDAPPGHQPPVFGVSFWGNFLALPTKSTAFLKTPWSGCTGCRPSGSLAWFCSWSLCGENLGGFGLKTRSDLATFFWQQNESGKPDVHPGRLTAGTWEFSPLERRIIFQTIIFRFELLIFGGVPCFLKKRSNCTLPFWLWNSALQRSVFRKFSDEG